MAETDESLHFLDYWRVISSRKEIVIAVSLLVVLAGIAVTYTMPRVYMSSTVVAVHEGTPTLDLFVRQNQHIDLMFLRTQFEIIQSRPVIEEAIQRLNLDTLLGRAYGYLDSPDRFETTWKLLVKSMNVQQFRDTNLIEIQFYLSEPKESAHRLVADIANEVAAVYRGQRIERSQRQMEQALQALQETLKAQEQRVRAAEQKLTDVRDKWKVDVVDSSARGTLPLDRFALTRLEEQRLAVRLELADKEARYRKIHAVKPEELLGVAPYVVADPSLSALVEQKRASEVRLSELRQSFGPKHPDVVSREAMVQQLSMQIADALSGLKAGVQVAYEAAKAKFDIVNAELETLKKSERVAEAQGYREFDAAREEVEHARSIRDTLETRNIQEQIELRIPKTVIEIITPASPANPKDPVSPNFLLNIVLSIVLGLGAGVGLAYFVEYMDTSVKTVEDVERAMGTPVLAVIPRGVRPLIDPEAQSGHAEAYRVLRTNMQFSKKLQGGKAITCTSGSVGEGKSLTIFNLAYVSAQLGDRVLVVDSDLHRPRQHKILGVSNKIGLTTILMGEATLEQAVVHTPQPNLDLLPSGRMSSQAHGLLDTSRMRDLVATVKQTYDRVFFDAPPIIGVSDATLLAREMDAVLLVIQHRKYPRAVSLRAKSMLEHTGANLLGVVLNNINISRDYYYYYYHYTSQRYGTGEEAKTS